MSLGIREGEFEPTLWLALQLMLGIASVICLKTASDSLFLSRFDARNLPYLDLAITGSVGLVVGVYIRLSNRLRLGRLIGLSQVFLALNLFIFWSLLKMDVLGVPALIYIWVGIFVVLIPSQVWSLAGIVFDTRQAKRLFSLIGAGGILGAALGGQFASIVGPRIGTESLLLTTMGLVLACSAIVYRLTSCRPAAGVAAEGPSKQKASIRETFRIVRDTRYFALMGTGLFLSTVVSTLVKFQFKATAQSHFGNDLGALTSFFGDFYGYIAVFGFLFHVLLTGRLLRWLGLGLCLLILPSSLMIALAALLIYPALSTAILARGADQSFRHSVDRASVELLYVPIPAQLRAQIKSFMDMVVSRWADGLASLILVLLLSILGLENREVSWAGLLFMLPWLGVMWQLRSEYVRTLRSSIERKDISAEAVLRNLAESPPQADLALKLQSSDLRAIETAVDWMEFSGASAGQAQLAALLTHESSAIRRKAMGAIVANEIPDCETEALKFLELEDEVEARWQAFEYLEGQDPDEAIDSFEKLLEHPDRDLAATAAARLLHHPGAHQQKAQQAFSGFVEWANTADSTARATAARLLGLAPPFEGSAAHLATFLRDREEAVVRAALQSAASLKPGDEVAAIVSMLQNRHVRREAREALAAFGDPIVDTLGSALNNPETQMAVRREIPRTIGAIGGPRAAALLLSKVDQSDEALRPPILRALGRIRRQHPEVAFDYRVTSRLVRDDLRRFYQFAVLLDGIPADSQPGANFLRRAITERQRQHLDSVFRLLALVYPQREILDAHYWIESGRPHLRSNALEFLDSRLASPTREMLLDALEEGGSDGLFRAAEELFGLQRLPFPGVLGHLLDQPDPWLRSCASYVAAEAEMINLGPRLKDLAHDRDALVAETAALAHSWLAASGGTKHPPSTTS